VTANVQDKGMKAFVIAERLREWDADVFERYGPLAAASIARFGGRYLALSDKLITLEGPLPPSVEAVRKIVSFFSPKAQRPNTIPMQF